MTSDQLRPAGRVVKASAVRLRRVDPHTVPTDQRIAEAEAAAFGAGYEEGYRNGAAEAGRDLAVAIAGLQRSVLAAIEQHRIEVRQARADDAERLVDLALAVAEWAVRRELASVPAAFFGRLGELLAERDRHQVVEVFTSPELVEATRTWLADTEPSGGSGIRVSAAEDLEAGEARVLLDDTTVFATFTDAFERAREVLDNLDGAGARGRVVAPDTDQTDGYGAAEAPADHRTERYGMPPGDPEDEVVELLYDATALLGEVAS